MFDKWVIGRLEASAVVFTAFFGVYLSRTATNLWSSRKGSAYSVAARTSTYQLTLAQGFSVLINNWVFFCTYQDWHLTTKKGPSNASQYLTSFGVFLLATLFYQTAVKKDAGQPPCGSHVYMHVMNKIAMGARGKLLLRSNNPMQWISALVLIQPSGRQRLVGGEGMAHWKGERTAGVKKKNCPSSPLALAPNWQTNQPHAIIPHEPPSSL